MERISQSTATITQDQDRVPFDTSELAATTRLTYIFWPHYSEAVPLILPYLENADVITYEQFTDRKTAKRFEVDFNALSRGESTHPDYDDLYEGNVNYTEYQIACALHGQGNKFVHIDAYREGNLRKLWEQFQNVGNEFQDCLSHYGRPSEAIPLFLDSSQKLADLTRIRDEQMAVKLSQVVDAHPGRHITLHVGAAHTDVAKQLNAVDPVAIKKVFIPLFPQSSVRFELGAQYSPPRYLMFGKKVPENILGRALLQFLVQGTLKKGETSNESYGINKFSRQETARFIDQLERAAKKIGKDPKAEFRYISAITQASKLAVKKLSVQK